ncbi:hypothetical protein M3J09_001078 [Ascochyta lentis]
MAGKNRKRRKKKHSSPTANAEPTTSLLAFTVVTNGEIQEPNIDDSLKAAILKDGTSLFLELQQQKIKSLIRVNNANENLAAEIVKLIERTTNESEKSNPGNRKSRPLSARFLTT